MKIAILGTGRVGTACAFALVMRGLGSEIVLVGRDRKRLEGDAMDLQHAAALISRADVRAATLDDAGGVDDADVIVLTSSKAVEGADRLKELSNNAEIFRALVPELARRAPRAIFIVVSNPVDVMTYLTIRLGSLPPKRVIGTGTLLDTVRFRATLSHEWQINPADVRAYIMGEHGDSQFAALSVASAGGVRIHDDDDLVLRAAESARTAGPKVFEAKGYTNYGVAASVAVIVDAIEHDSLSVMPVSTLIDGYLGVNDVCLSVPCVIGRAGIVRMLPIDLDAKEVELFRRSADVLKQARNSVPSPGTPGEG